MSERGTYGQPRIGVGGRTESPSRLSAWIGGGIVVGVGVLLWRHVKQSQGFVSTVGAFKAKHPDLTKWLTPAQQDAYWDAYNVKRGKERHP